MYVFVFRLILFAPHRVQHPISLIILNVQVLLTRLIDNRFTRIPSLLYCTSYYSLNPLTMDVWRRKTRAYCTDSRDFS